MDPDVLLALLREWSRGERGEYLANGASAQEGFEALDEWLSRGGFLPEAWRRDNGRKGNGDG